MVELMRGVGFGIPVMPQGAFYVFADASRFTEDSYKFAFELLEKAGVGVAPGVDFGQAGKRAVRFSYASSEGDSRGPTMRIRVGTVAGPDPAAISPSSSTRGQERNAGRGRRTGGEVLRRFSGIFPSSSSKRINPPRRLVNSIPSGRTRRNHR